jgi:hemolysin III
LANTLTHGAGVLLSVAGGALLAYRAASYASLTQTIAVCVYSVSLVAVFAASTLYHATSAAAAPRLKNALLWLDHSCIYGLIAGTYTPFMVGVLRGAAGAAVLCAVWGLAVAGVVAKTLLKVRSDLISIPFYLAMGWMIVVVIRPFANALGAEGMTLLLAGGLCYSLGIVFFLGKLAYFHTVWHGLVLSGAALHYVCVLFYATPS